ncbi:WXG100 family type VII secretion target [Lentzea albidocapillata]|uniref:WXG100 family type VII secretion target n=1 Tax=Lentzea albidocapillata TaxID=40571 RepID=A0A1W2DHT6_9PSEU|nr:WXG100 family type VII secretion target [Lentzea albidocapillata]SMC96538.1 WXG100 family type VII secretion target [Lentzea albidocapillata]
MGQPIDGYSVSGNIPHLADQMKQYTNELQNELDTLMVQLKPMRDSWIGSGSNAYDVCQQNWNGILARMAGSFSKAGLTMTMAYDNYNRTDQGIMHKFGGV